MSGYFLTHIRPKRVSFRASITFCVSVFFLMIYGMKNVNIFYNPHSLIKHLKKNHFDARIEISTSLSDIKRSQYNLMEEINESLKLNDAKNNCTLGKHCKFSSG